jgi:RNA polymerase sigma-70 factor, ECF subfamily
MRIACQPNQKVFASEGFQGEFVERGDAIPWIYDRYHPVVLAFAVHRTADPTQADDIVSQTFVQALQALPRYEERGATIGAWLLRIAAHVVADQARRQRRVAAVLPRLWYARDACDERNPEDWVQSQERRAWLCTHLQTLSVEQRHALWLRYGEGRRVREVATQIGRSEGATKQMLARTLKTLRGRLESERVLQTGTPAESTPNC